MDVAVINYHYDDEYQNDASFARIIYYNVSGFPTSKFDGVLSSSGGGVNLYPSYLQKYNSRIAIPSSYTIGVQGTNSGQEEYELEITIEKVASGIDNPVMHVVVTESHIPESWGGLSEVNYAERVMAPNQNGTTLDFSGGDIQEHTINFTLEPEWVNEECELVIFLQNNSTKEVLQGSKFEIMDFGTSNTNDASILGVMSPNTVCKNSFIPKVEIANYGLDNLTSLDIVYQVNEQTSETYAWTGNLAYLESETIVLPELSFEIESSNTFIVEAENPNETDDQYPSNNTYSVNLAHAANVPYTISLILKLDDNPEEISWEVLNSTGTVMYSGGDYTTAGQNLIETFELTDPDCYAFIIYDEGGDGLTGTGNFRLAYGTPITFFAEGKYFGYEDEIQFGVGLTGEAEIVVGNVVSVYPNPTAQKAQVSFELPESATVEMQVFNALGMIVYTYEENMLSSGKHVLEIDGKGLNAGVYYVNLKIDDSIETQKLIIK